LNAVHINDVDRYDTQETKDETAYRTCPPPIQRRTTQLISDAARIVSQSSGNCTMKDYTLQVLRAQAVSREFLKGVKTDLILLGPDAPPDLC
jgi:hypothetical protein